MVDTNGSMPQRPAPLAAEPTVGQLFGKVTESISKLVRDELQLAQAQIADKGKALGVGGAFFGVAAVFGLFGFGWLLTAAMFGLAEVLPFWASALIVGVVLLVIAAIAGLIGKMKVGKGTPPTPETVQNVKKDIAALKQGVKS